jgi:hypothetical protein
MGLSIEEVRDLKEALVCDKNRKSLTYTCCLELIDTIESMQQDIEQLLAQVARMREALFDYKTFLESFQCGCEPSDETCPGVYCERCCRLNQANETLDEVDKAIGGKTDV